MLKISFALSITIASLMLTSGCGLGGACVGSGGSILLSDVCGEGYDADECEENNEIGLNDASWTHHPGASCSSLGYSEECSDGSFREPGACN
jgi:hypothetical protein